MPGIPDADTLLGYVAANVRRLREKAELTQEQLAELAAIDLTYLQRIERGTANPSVRVLAGVAVALEVMPGRLFRKARAVPRTLGRPPTRRKK